VERPRHDDRERAAESATAEAKEATEAKQRSVLIPLDAEDALRALGRFAYSGDGDEDEDDSEGPRGKGGRS
jgi:hypothetical protein